MTFNSYNLKIKAKTWKRDSYGLFDYEAVKDYQNQRLSVSNPGQIIRLNHQISFSNLDSESTQRNKTISDNQNLKETLFYTVQTRDGIKIAMNHPKNKTDPINENNQLWNVVPKGNTSQGFVLKAQDVIKLGRIMFKIIQMKLGNETRRSTDRQIYRNSIINSIKDHIMTREETFIINSESPEEGIKKQTKGSQCSNNASDMVCKICLYDNSDEDNDPLISPCKCIGSVKYVHLKCVQNWIRSKCDMQHEGNIITILWKNLNCELCKEKLPVTLTQDQEELCLIPLDQRISDSYVIFESFSKDNDSIGIHLIDLSVNQTLSIGRGHACDIKVSDISVSREHAKVTFSKGRLEIRDNNSKFGTLVKRAGALVLNSANMKCKFYQQCGRTIFKFSLERPWITFIPCFSQIFNSCSSTTNRMEAIENENNDETRIRIVDEDDEEIQG